MRTPERLMHSERGLAQTLLKAGSREHAPPKELLGRTLLAIGITEVAMAATANAAVSQVSTSQGTAVSHVLGQSVASTQTASAFGGGVLGAGSTVALFAKALAIGAGIGALVVTTAVITDKPHSARSTTSSVASQWSASNAARNGHVLSPSKSATTESAVDSLREPKPQPSRSTSRDKVAEEISKERLAAESARISRAQIALDGDHAEKALEILDDYDASFPNGQLRPEASLLRERANQSLFRER